MLLSWLAVVLVASVARAEHLGYDYYDINDVYDEFDVDCGTPTDRKMIILYGGNARKVYSSEDPINCAAVEVSPAVWRIDITDFNDTDCPITLSHDPEVVMLDVVVQMNSVRTITDKLRQITCNYGLNGQQKTSLTDTAHGSLIEAQPVWESANNATSNTTVTMLVYGTDNNPVATAYLGNYVQLRAFLATEPGEEYSLRMYNCRAFDSTMSYYMLIAGCGQNAVLPDNRGFRTKQEDGVTAFRVARSSYFKTFLLPSNDNNLRFECDYVICDQANLDDCDTYSCANSVAAGRRKKRAAPAPEQKFRTGLPTVETPVLSVVPRPEEKQRFTVGSELLIQETVQHEPKMHVPKKMKKVVYATDDEPEEALVLGLDALTLTLVVVFAVLTTAVLVLACALVCLRRRAAPLTEKILYEDQLPRKF